MLALLCLLVAPPSSVNEEADTWTPIQDSPVQPIDALPVTTPSLHELRDTARHADAAELQHELRSTICRSAAGHELQDSLAVDLREHVRTEFLPGFIKSGLAPVTSHMFAVSADTQLHAEHDRWGVQSPSLSLSSSRLLSRVDPSPT